MGWLRACRALEAEPGSKQQEMGGVMVEVVYVCVFVLILQVAWAEPHAAPGIESRGFCPE